MKVLIIERSRLQQTVLSRIFSGEGIVVSLANSYSQAIERLETEMIDMVCTSYQLDQDKTGIDLTRAIRLYKKYTEIPIILMPSIDKDVSVELAYSAGVTEICNRQSADEISSTIQAILNRRVCTVCAHVLYVEDSKTAALLTMRDLKKTNITFDHYVNASDALASYQTNGKSYDMIITDVVLEGSMDGLSFVRAIREITPENYKMPILAVSGFDDTSRRVELLRSGANDYIVKPYVKEEMLVRVKNLITTKHLFDQVAIQQEQLYQQAMKDHLTGLYNRHALNSFLPKISSTAIRHKAPIGILFFDIDHFKQVNDQNGHLIGDMVLEKIGQIILHNFRAEDFCARYGGEEFLVIMSNTHYQQTLAIAEKIGNKIEHTAFGELRITISIGALSSHLNNKDDINELLDKADEALYQAKEMGRNRVCSIDNVML